MPGRRERAAVSVLAGGGTAADNLEMMTCFTFSLCQVREVWVGSPLTALLSSDKPRFRCSSATQGSRLLCWKVRPTVMSREQRLGHSSLQPCWPALEPISVPLTRGWPETYSRSLARLPALRILTWRVRSTCYRELLCILQNIQTSIIKENIHFGGKFISLNELLFFFKSGFRFTDN